MPLTSRRVFLRTTGRSTAAVALAAPLLTRLTAAEKSRFIPAASTDPQENPLFMSATKLAGLIRTGKISSVEAVQLALRRIDTVNPRLNAVVTFCRERALTEAAAADARLAKGQIHGPLHGVPMSITDALETAEVISTGGTPGRKNTVGAKDATVVARLRAAGAILLGKTNTAELALGEGQETDSPVFGRTLNPYDASPSSGGPSGGAGAIVAAGGASFDLGSGRDSSVRSPALANGLAGLTPTFGRCPRTGHLAHRGGPYDAFLEIGPLARRVEDLTLLLGILAGPDRFDPLMAPVPLGNPTEVTLRNLRIAFYTSSGFESREGPGEATSPETAECVQRSVRALAELGGPVTESRPPKLAELREARRVFLQATGGDDLRRLLAKHGSTSAAPVGVPISSPEFTRACEELDALKSEQLAWFESYDLVICPGPHSFGPLGNSPVFDPANTNGWPAGVVRMGTSVVHAGLPLGVQIMSPPWRDDAVLAALTHLEGKLGGWQKPPL